MNPPHDHEAALINLTTRHIFPLDPELTSIGRKTGNTIVLTEDLKVSRHHVTISRDGPDYVLQDLGSSNGTFVNHRRLTAPHRLESGDIIQIGDTTFEVQLNLEKTETSLSRSTPSSPSPPAQDETRPSQPAATETDIFATATSTPPAPAGNPYVGPRTFTQEERNLFFGRENEARELLSLIISNRLTLFCAQSGAGKSSLLNTRTIPQLRENGNAVLPTGRVSGALPEGVDDVANVYIFNLLLSLDESDGDPHRFTDMSLARFLTKLTSLDGQHYFYDEKDEKIEDDLMATEEFEEMPYVLVIDQFEEIINTYPGRWQEREAFFAQLGEAMAADPLLWVVLSMREDYVIALDPYLPLLPDNLRARFYMQRMEYEAALEAIKRPAESYGRPFAPGVAETLVDNLRQIRVHGAQGLNVFKTRLGQFVEPVQLQVVCYQLWENLKGRPSGLITEQDLRELGDVDTALAQFYEQAIHEVIEQSGVSEIILRNWFEMELITESGTRGTVYRGQTETGGIPNRAVDILADRFLLRSEARTGGTWYELVHDRFVTPILQANQAWRLEQPLIQLAHDWQEAQRDPGKLLEGQSLEQHLASNWRGLGPLVEEFLQASQVAQREREEAARQSKEAQRLRELAYQKKTNAKLRRRAWLLAAFTVAALLLAGIAWYSARQAGLERDKANAALNIAATESAAASINADQVQIVAESINEAQMSESEAADSGDCSVAPAPTFQSVWEEQKDELACPEQVGLGGRFIEQNFENGFMLWPEIRKLFFVFVADPNDPNQGRWRAISRESVDDFGANYNLDQCQQRPIINEQMTPSGNFGVIWCTQAEVQAALGQPVELPRDVADNLFQEYGQGYMILNSEGQVYVLLAGDEAKSQGRYFKATP